MNPPLLDYLLLKQDIYSHISPITCLKFHLDCRLPQEPCMNPLDTPTRPEGTTA